MTLVKTSLLNAIAVTTRILAAVGLNKILALYIGPGGYAVVGQFANALTVVGSIGGGAIATGVTKYTAEHGEDRGAQRAVSRAAFRYIVAATLLTSLVVLAFSDALAKRLLGDVSLASVFVWLALGLPMLTFNALLLSIINGRKDVRRYVAQNISASVLGALTAAALAVPYGVKGALFAFLASQTAIVFVTLWLCRKADWLERDSFMGDVPINEVRKLAGFALMALTSAAAGPIAQVLVRNHLIDTFGISTAGEWQAVFKVSEIYIQLFTATLGIYLLPRLAEIREAEVLWHELVKVCRMILPLAILVASVIYVLREWVTTTLFADGFLGMVDLFGWQLVGDVLKVGGWIFGYVMLGRGMVRWFIMTEILFGAVWVVLTFALTPVLGRAAAPAAFAVNYGLYWIFMANLVRREMRTMK